MIRVSTPFAVLAVIAVASAAHADPPLVHATLTYTLQDDTASACADEAALREQIAVRLGYDPFEGGRDDRAVDVTIARGPKKRGFHAAISIAQPGLAPATHALDGEGDRCDELTRSVVLAVSLALDPIHFAHPATPATLPLASPHDVPVDEPASPPPAPPAPRPSWNVDVVGGARSGLGLVPSPSLGPLLGLHVGKAGGFVLTEVGADLPLGHVVGPRGAGRVEASLLRAGGGACATPLLFALCARVDVGALEGKGEGTTTVNGTSFYAAAAATLGVLVPLGERFQIGANAEAVLPLSRTTLYLDGLSAWTTPSVAGAFGLSVGYRL